jgi:hypothetical protein
MCLGLSGVIDSVHDTLKRAQLDKVSHSAATLETTSWLAEPSFLARLLRSLRDDRNAVAQCANQSYRHPLGFQKIMLLNGEPQFDLRLHVWWPDSDPGVDHVHNHRFAFASTVVAGGYQMQLFHPDPAGVPMAEYREQISPHGGWELTPVGTTRLGVLTSVHLTQGASYALAANALHRVTVAPGSLCVTLLLRTALGSGPATRVFAAPDDRVPAMIPASQMSGEDYREQLEALIGELDG